MGQQILGEMVVFSMCLEAAEKKETRMPGLSTQLYFFLRKYVSFATSLPKIMIKMHLFFMHYKVVFVLISIL